MKAPRKTTTRSIIPRRQFDDASGDVIEVKKIAPSIEEIEIASKLTDKMEEVPMLEFNIEESLPEIEDQINIDFDFDWIDRSISPHGIIDSLMDIDVTLDDVF